MKAPPWVVDVIRSTCEQYGVSVEDFRNSSKRPRNISAARAAAARRIAAHPNISSGQIARWLGGMNHTSVLYMLREATMRAPLYRRPLYTPPELTGDIPDVDLSGEWAI